MSGGTSPENQRNILKSLSMLYVIKSTTKVVQSNKAQFTRECNRSFISSLQFLERTNSLFARERNDCVPIVKQVVLCSDWNAIVPLTYFRFACSDGNGTIAHRSTFCITFLVVPFLERNGSI